MNMRIIILSRSGELYSTRSLYNAARRRNHFVRVVDHMHCDLMVSNQGNDIYFNGQSLHGYDAIIPRIGHTATTYGSAVIRQFESMGVVSTLNSEPLLRARDKLSCLQLLSAQGVKVPKTVYANNQYFLRDMAEKLEGFPKILKLISGTHGIGVIKLNDQKTMESMMEAFIGVKQKALLQEFIAESSGVDIRAFVVNGEVIASMKRQAQEGEFRSNLHRGATAQVIELTEEERQTALKSVEIMGLKVAGVDMLRSNRGPLVLEVNASPGLEGIESTTQIDVSKRIIQYVEKTVRANG